MNSKIQENQSVEDLSFFEIIKIIVAQKYLILGTVLVCTLAVVILAVLTRPVYRAEAVVIPVSGDSLAGIKTGILGQIGGLGALSGLSGGGADTRYESLAMLRSSALVREFIEKNGLQSVLLQTVGKTEEPLKDDETIAESLSLNRAVKLFSESILEIDEDLLSQTITIRIDWTDRKQAAMWANDIVRLANSQLREKRIRDAQESLKYLHHELESTSVVGVQQEIFALISTQINSVVLANVRKDFAFKFVDPAVAPDEGNHVYPKTFKMTAVAIIVSFIFGITLALARHAWRQAKLSAQKK